MRIISGNLRGRKLISFEADNIRPTSDLVKESIFNTLRNEVEGSVFLDLFGGTGNVGFEAISRDAEKVYIVDNNRSSIRVINENNEKLGAGAVVIAKDFRVALQDFASRNIKFDIIFIDPPYDTDFGLKAVDLIKELDLLTDDGLMVFETRVKTKLTLPEYCNIYADKKYGIKRVVYFDYSK